MKNEIGDNIMQDENYNQNILHNVISRIKENFEPILIEFFSDLNPPLENFEGIQELESWYQKAREEDNIFEKILKDIINECMKYLPQHYANLCIENIKINSKDKKRNVKFSINFQFEPIKTFVEFGIKVNKIRKKTGRIVFKIDFNGSLNDIEINSDKEDKSKVFLGIISGEIHLSIIEIPFMKINEPIDLGTKVLEVDLSNYCIIDNHSSDT